MTSSNSNSIPEEKAKAPVNENLASVNLERKIRNHVINMDILYEFSTKAQAYFLSNPGSSALFNNHKTIQATWLFCLAATSPDQYINMGITSMDEFYIEAMRIMNNDASINGWHAWKCSSLKALRTRLAPFNKALKSKANFSYAFESMVDHREGNSNALRIGIEQQAFLVNQCSDASIGLNSLYRKYLERSGKMIELGFWLEDESKLSESALKYFLRKPEIVRIRQMKMNDPRFKISITKI